LRDLFTRFCHRTRFNRIRRNLHAVIEEIRKELSVLTEYKYETYSIIDSIPIPVCKFYNKPLLNQTATAAAAVKLNGLFSGANTIKEDAKESQ
jgi:hypothetical protein